MTKDANSSLDEDVISISVGDWCAVEYEGMIYPGEVKVIVGDDYQVSSVMVPAGKHWKRPNSLHVDEISTEQVGEKTESTHYSQQPRALWLFKLRSN